MYNRDKIMQLLKDIKAEAETIDPYMIIAQPRRSKKETAAQTFSGYGLNHVDCIGHSFAFIDCEGMMVDVARNYLIEHALLNSNAKYLFFIGDDTVVPYDAFEILHKTAEENPGAVVTGVYYIKCGHAMISVRDQNYIRVPNVDPGQVFEAWQTGMDCMLIPMEVLRQMQKEEPELPFCCVANGIEDIPFIGEDNFFVHRLRRHGVKLLVNTDVQCLHMDLATGKYTAHPDVNLNKFYTNVKPTSRLTLDDKRFIDHRWFSRLPNAENNPNDYENYTPGFDIPNVIGERKNPIGIEIGTEEALTSHYLLSNIENLKLFGIDKDPTDTVLSLAKTSNNFVVIHKTQDDALKQFKDASLDFVFINTLEDYDDVLNTCKNYWKKLKPGGMMMGHKFAFVESVNHAANDFSNEVGLAVKTGKQDLWYITKE